jgi:hypothetical protein
MGEKFWEEFLYDTDPIENTASNSSSIVTCVFVDAETCLPSRFLATGPLCSSDRRDTHADAQGKEANNRGTVGGGVFSVIRTEVT